MILSAKPLHITRGLSAAFGVQRQTRTRSLAGKVMSTLQIESAGALKPGQTGQASMVRHRTLECISPTAGKDYMNKTAVSRNGERILLGLILAR